ALGHLGDYEAAVASYDKALEIKPHFPDAQSRRALALDNNQSLKSLPRSNASEGRIAEERMGEESPFADHPSVTEASFQSLPRIT
ncbi:MAG TPA: tetratricopeptide repeat protein, partial [Crinalium sp.]